MKETFSNTNTICSSCSAKRYPKGGYTNHDPQWFVGKLVKLRFPTTPLADIDRKKLSTLPHIIKRWPSAEIIWVRVQDAYVNGELLGQIFNEPFFINMAQGEEIFFNKSEIVDILEEEQQASLDVAEKVQIMITAENAWERIIGAEGRIFKVTFQTKTSQHQMTPEGLRTQTIIAGPGRIRTMLCRRLVQKFALGIISPEQRMTEDVTNNVLTVWDLETFRTLRLALEDQGMTPFTAMMTAGRRSYRRINMAQVVDIVGA